MLLSNQIAVVTGAGTGIGRAAALKLASEEALVCLMGRTPSTLADTLGAIEAAGGRGEVCPCDVTDPVQIAETVAAIEARHGGIDILVNNAGMSREQPFLEMSVELFDEICVTNLRSVMLMMKAVLPGMVARGKGSVVNIGSGAAVRGLPGSAAYSVSKAGVVALTQSVGDEMRKYGVRVNVICPGPVDTELFKKSERREFILQAGGDVFEPETVTNGILFLASDLSGCMNSQTLLMRGFNRW